MGKQFFYRGYLTSCNYRCGYCPFSKRKMTEEQSRKDQEALEQFVRQMKAETEDHALLMVPYGEALIHEYYWVAMAQLSQYPSEEYVGCQTNLSFPVEKMLSIYEACGGEKRKLRLWCTFHPSMTTVESFVRQCKKLGQAGITYCAGAVGDPANISLIQKLREQLPDDIYVWVNKMDGRRQGYTREEIQRFLEIDPYFPLELQHRRTDLSKCRKSIFQEADGRRYFCNLHAAQAGGGNSNIVAHAGGSRRNIHAVQPEKTCQDVNVSQCKRRECSCYLAYCNRTDVAELLFFEPYPAFRIPIYPKGIFLDVDGTLVKEGKRALSDTMAEKIRWLSKKSRLYLATALPYPEAMGKCRKIADCLSGGVFADGGHILVWESTEVTNRQIKWEEVIPLPTEISQVCDRLLQHGRRGSMSEKLPADKTVADEADKVDKVDKNGLAALDSRSIHTSVGCRSYQIRGIWYKQTLFSKRKQGWMPGEAENLIGEIKAAVSRVTDIRIHQEKHHIGILNAEADKKTGVEKICTREGIALEEGMAVGNEKEDLPMLSLFPRSVLVGKEYEHDVEVE